MSQFSLKEMPGNSVAQTRCFKCFFTHKGSFNKDSQWEFRELQLQKTKDLYRLKSKAKRIVNKESTKDNLVRNLYHPRALGSMLSWSFYHLNIVYYLLPTLASLFVSRVCGLAFLYVNLSSFHLHPVTNYSVCCNVFNMVMQRRIIFSF